MSTNPETKLVNILNKMSLHDRFTYYCEHNDRITSTKNVYLQNFNCYCSLPLTEGNSKVDALIFDLLAIVTCLNCKSCKSTCYAIKAQRQYSDTLLKRTINTWLAKHDLPTLQKIIIDQLSHTKRTIVRIHSSGDFLSQAYIDMWTSIAAMFPHIRFYTYSKVLHIFDFSAFEALPNTNIVRSILPDGSINYGPEDYVKAKAKEFNATICPYRAGMKKENKPHCGRSCFKCVSNQLVLFVQH